MNPIPFEDSNKAREFLISHLTEKEGLPKEKVEKRIKKDNVCQYF